MMREIAVGLLLALCLGPAFADHGATGKELTPEKREVFERRLGEVEAILVKEPKNAALWRKKGFFQQALGRAEDARVTFEKFVELEPKDASGYYMLGLVYEKLKMRPEAIAAWRSCERFAVKEKHRETAKRHLSLLLEGL